MSNSISCIVPKSLAEDERFHALKESYSGKQYTDDALAQGLQLCREFYGYDSNWFPETAGQKSVFTRFMNNHLAAVKLAQTDSDLSKDDVYNLYTTLYTLFTQDQLYDILETIEEDFSAEVDKLERADNANHSRQELIELEGNDKETGFQVIMRRVFAYYETPDCQDAELMIRQDEEEDGAYTDEERAERLKRYREVNETFRTMVKNKERLIALAADRIGENEGFHVRGDNFEISVDEPEEEDMIQQEDENHEEDNGHDDTERSKGDRYVDFRLTKLMDSLSPKVKRYLSRLPRLRPDGREINNYLFRARRLDTREAAITLTRIVSDSTPETFLDDLLTWSDKYPWLKELHRRLTNEDSNFAADIYSNFKKVAYRYQTVIRNPRGSNYKVQAGNAMHMGNALMREAGNNMSAGNGLGSPYTIYDDSGYLVSHKKAQEVYGKVSSIRDKVVTLASAINMVDGMRTMNYKNKKGEYNTTPSKAVAYAMEHGLDIDYLFDTNISESDKIARLLDENPDIERGLSDMLRGAGFDISPEDIRESALQRMTVKQWQKWVDYRLDTSKAAIGMNKLVKIAQAAGDIYGLLNNWTDPKRGMVQTGRAFYNTIKELGEITKWVALTKSNEVDNRAVVNNKSMATYNNTNLLNQVTDKLNNKQGLSEEQYRAMLERDYLQYEGMALGEGSTRKITGWLKYLYEHGGHASITLIDAAGFNNKEYFELTSREKLINEFIQFSENWAFPVPIQSDYGSAYNFIKTRVLSPEQIIDELTDEVLIELERIASIQARLEDNNRIKLNTYEDQGQRLLIFPEMNYNSFIMDYKQAETPEAARDVVHTEVTRQLDKIIAKDIARCKAEDIFSDKRLNSVHVMREDGVMDEDYISFYDGTARSEELDAKRNRQLRLWSMNTFYARQQICKIYTGGLQQFDGTLGYEKRNMMLHVPHSSMYTKATWNGEQVGKENYTVAYLGDDIGTTAFMDEIKASLDVLHQQGFISATQRNRMAEVYGKNKLTDGQGFRTFESWREVRIMSGNWNDRLEDAYQHIIAGKPQGDDLDIIIEAVKPVMTGYEHIPAANGEHQKPVRATVLHKYSEQVLLPLALTHYCMQGRNTPLHGLAMAQERLAQEGQRIDLFLFHSNVKVGAHSVMRPFARWSDVKFDTERGMDAHAVRREMGFTKDMKLTDHILTDAKSIANYIYSMAHNSPETLHVFPYESYGISASTKAHGADNSIAIAAQAEKAVWNNTNMDVDENGDMKVNGRRMKTAEGRELYYQMKTAEIINQYVELCKMFSNGEELEKLFEEELSSKSYTSREVRYALTRLKDGTFALPLYSPNVQNEVQQLLSSIIKKRLTKKKDRGNNILQATSLGVDIDISPYDNPAGTSEDDKLGIKFSSNGNIKYVEVFMTIQDERLKPYADKNGVITPERLRQLVADKVIPEEAITFFAYRTPSDGAHSVIVCRVKGFISNVEGEKIMMPREVMKMTGHDYDGDKLRCHFPYLKSGWDYEKMEEDWKRSYKITAMRYALGLSESEPVPLERAVKWYKSSDNPERDKYRKIEYIQYDYDKNALDNSPEQIHNGKIQLIVQKMRTPIGSAMMLIPGGCDETYVYAQTHEIIRLAQQIDPQGVGMRVGKLSETAQQRVASILKSVLYLTDDLEQEADDAVRDVESLYDYLTGLDENEVSDILNAMSGMESPFSVSHSIDAFNYIMGGADMISPYATYNSAFALMQRLNIHYIPKQTNTGKTWRVKIFDNEFGIKPMFSMKNQRGEMATMGYSRLLNAAVDNGKKPVLGYVNQNKAMSSLTNFLFANNMAEEDIHMLLNQPIIRAIADYANRMGLDFNSDTAMTILMNSGVLDIKDLEKWTDPYNHWIPMEDEKKGVMTISRETMKSYLGLDFKAIAYSQDLDAIRNQLNVMHFLLYNIPAAVQLTNFVRVLRPDSESGALGAQISDLIAKEVKLRELRQKVDDGDVWFSGYENVIRRREINGDMKKTAIVDAMGEEIPEIVALNSTMIDGGADLFGTMFPQVHDDWVDVAADIAGEYDYPSIQPNKVKQVTQEMILFKLLGNKKFATGDIREEQRRIIIDVPKRMLDLKDRIGKAERTRETAIEGENVTRDYAAEKLAGNIFLNNMTVRWADPQDADKSQPRIQFRLNGPAIQGSADAIRGAWNDLMMSYDDEIRQLAVDLFKYNMYTNGFSFGAYEFAHFAPYSVIVSTPGYLEALRDIMTSKWTDQERQRFYDQYHMNHWGESRFIPSIDREKLSYRVDENDKRILWLDPKDNTWVRYAGFVIVRDKLRTESGKTRIVESVYKVINDKNGSNDVTYLYFVPKLGLRNANKQVTLQYAPGMDYTEITPVVAGNESAWGVLSSNGSRFKRIENRMERQAETADISGAEEAAERNKGAFNTLMSGLDSRDQLAKNSMMNFINASLHARRPGKGESEKDEDNSVEASKANTEITEKQPTPAQQAEANTTSVSDTEPSVNDVPPAAPIDARDMAAFEFFAKGGKGKFMLSLATRDEKGNPVIIKVPNTPRNRREVVKQEAFVRLNPRLREILRSKGIAVGIIEHAEDMMRANGVTTFDSGRVTAEGMMELIRLSEGYSGEMALPEEFAHVSLEMLGYEHNIVKRLLDVLSSNEAALIDAFEGQYNEYRELYQKEYPEDWQRYMLIEAAGKLVAKSMLRQQEQEITSNPVRNLLRRVVEAIKQMWRRFTTNEFMAAIYDAERISSKLAKSLMDGSIIGDMKIENIGKSHQFYQVKTDLSGKNDVLSKLLKIASKRLAILKKRSSPDEVKNPTGSLLAAQLQVDKLQKDMQNYKVESAVVTYMIDSIDFLAQMEQLLDDAVDSGRGANVVCRHLNIVRDTLFSFSQSIDAVNDAIVDGEIENSQTLRDAINKVQGVVSEFYINYENIGMAYFENMLENVYGKEGVTLTVGRNKGRTITIKEMARKADNDIGLAARALHSLADSGDYVLMAIDDWTRDAKMNARKRANQIRSQIEVMMADLIRETGSRDMSFMFAKDVNGEKTGYYVDKSTGLNRLTDAQRKFYDRFVEIKESIDKLLPESLVEDKLRIIMIRKTQMEKVRDAHGAAGKGLAMWENIQNMILDDESNEYGEVAVDFENNKIDRLPIKYLFKGENESYDDMTDDAAMSLMAYAGMAVQYDEVSNVINILENAKYMASERDIAQSSGGKELNETIDTNPEDEETGVRYTERFTKKAMLSNAQKALEDYFQMQLYGHMRKAEGTIGNTRISKRKLADLIASITSWSQMALNLPQRIANINVGATQILIESLGKGVFTAKNAKWASGVYMRETADRLAETGRTDYDNKLSLFADYFDLHQKNGREFERYNKKNLSRTLNSGVFYAGLTAGEDYLALTTGLSIADTIKVKGPKGEKGNLWDAYEVKYRDKEHKTGAYLSLKSGYTLEDGSLITSEIERQYTKRVAGMNFELQGIYNQDDKSAIQQYALGTLFIMYRKWIAPSIKRRYGKASYSVLRGEEREGYHITMFRLLHDAVVDAKDEVGSAAALLNIFTGVKAIKNSIVINWNKFDEYEKSNVKRSAAEMAVITLLWAACAALGKIPPEEIEGDDRSAMLTWWDRLLFSQILRLRSEMGSMAPTPLMVDEAMHILRSPFAAIGPISNVLNSIKILFPVNWVTEIKSGRYKGHVKAYKYFRELPFISIYKKLENFVDPTPLINYYKSDVVF